MKPVTWLVLFLIIVMFAAGAFFAFTDDEDTRNLVQTPAANQKAK